MKHLWLAATVFPVGVLTAAPLLAQSHEARPVAGQRQVIELAEGWRFIQDDALRGAEAPGFADSHWARVQVPHTWNRVGNYLPEPQSHINQAKDINKALGVGWYRISFSPPATFSGKRVWLEFDAASRAAEVWLNGKRLGEHRGGFSRFRFDATDAIRSDGPNILAVKADNRKPELGSTTVDVLPLAGDFFIHGGLYRPVRLIATDPVHIDLLDFGGPGVYARTTSIASDRAAVAVRTKLRNDGTKPARLRLVTRLVDHAGKVVAETRTGATMAPGQSAEIPQALRVSRPHLWQGVDDPYLYRLIVEVRRSNGQLLDVSNQAFGIREIRIDADRGFFLNNKPYKLHGVGLHQDREGKGWALSAADIETDVAMLRDMGANTIRLTHYQHGKIIHDLADRYGLILWDEIPLVSVWTVGKETDASTALRANARQQLQELIRQNYNHPSVITWGIANEVDFGDSLPIFLSNPDGPPPNPEALLRELNQLAKEEDPSRPTALATCCEKGIFKPGAIVPITAPQADLGGANRYFGWYTGTPDDLDGHLEALRRERPAQPLAVTEYGAGGAITMHTDNPLGGPVDARGRAQPEEYMSYVHERSWSILQTKPYLWATWLWNSFDFATTIRREGDADDINTKGLITYDRRIKKDPYFFYKAHWSSSPTVHITSRRYVQRAYSVTDVRVYSNASTTELIVNGKSVGARAACPNRICIWQNVRLSPGANKVVARGAFDSKSVEDQVEWQLAPQVVTSTRIDSGALIAAQSTNGIFGSDNFFDGGKALSVNRPSNYGRPAERKQIAGTTDSDLAATYREGEFRYRIPLDNGAYKVTLTFVEPNAKVGERQFDVHANGASKLLQFDVAKTAGAPLKAVTRAFEVEVRNGLLDIGFKPVKGQAIVSAVQVERR
jgi:beta-galactosidase